MNRSTKGINVLEEIVQLLKSEQPPAFPPWKVLESRG